MTGLKSTQAELERAVMAAIAAAGGVAGATFDGRKTLREYGVSSLALFQFASDVEGQLSAHIPDTAFRPENFSSLKAIVDMLSTIEA